jgi:hypothetical protein
MAGVIVLSSTEATTNTDILQGTRLQTVPAGGFLTFELCADFNTAAAAYTTSIQMPNGDTPLNDVAVPSANPQTAGVIDDRQKLMITLPIAQGGHTVFSCTEIGGGAILSWRVTYTPA